MRVYHTGFQEIREPDVRYGRKNADFGQGFYLSPEEEFSIRWAKSRQGADPILNAYELDVTGLRVKEFSRDRDWFDYIFANRSGGADSLYGVDVIVGPIANDTLYNTFGILTSGLVDRGLALRALTYGQLYTQVVLKTERAAGQLKWLSARKLEREEVAARREQTLREEWAYQEWLAQLLNEE